MKVNFKGFKDSVVKDESGKEILSFEKSKALPTRECYSIINAQQEKAGNPEERSDRHCSDRKAVHTLASAH